MRRLRFLFILLVVVIAGAACSLDRGVSDSQNAEPAETASAQDGSGDSTPEPDSPAIKLPEIDLPAGAVSTAQAAVRQAGDAAGTAVQQAGTAVQQAGDAAGTAAVVATEQGGAALATVQAISTPDFSALTEKLATVRPDEDGNVSITLNESELNQLLQLRYLVMSAEPELRDASVRFESGLIVVSGNVPLLLPVGITLSLRPVVADGRFDLEILDASLGPIDAPDLILDFTSDLVSSALDDVIRRLPEGFRLQSITVDEGQLTISGRIDN